MSFNVTKSDGTIFATIADQTINTASSLALAGIGSNGVAQAVANNFIKLTENFSSGSAPLNPITGQIWYNKTSGQLSIYNGSAWASLLSALTSTTIIPNTSNDGTPATTAFVHSLFLQYYRGTALPLVNGNAAVGTSIKFAHEDHVHPHDTSLYISPAFTGTPTAPTAGAGTNTTQLATTAFVMNAVSGLGVGTILPIMNGVANVGQSLKFAREDHIHPSDITRAALDSPTFTGVPTAPTAASGTNSNQIATTAFVTRITGLITQEVIDRKNADQNVITQLTLLVASSSNTLNNITASISTEQTVRASGDAANATSITNLTATFNSSISTINTTLNTLSTSVDTLSSSVSTYTSTFNSNIASLTNTVNTIASNDTAQSTAITNLTSTLNGQSASIASNLTAIDGLSATWSIQASINNTTGGLEFTGIRKADGTGAYYNLEINSNVVINGDAVINGTITANELANNSVSNILYARAAKNTGYLYGIVPITGKVLMLFSMENAESGYTSTRPDDGSSTYYMNIAVAGTVVRKVPVGTWTADAMSFNAGTWVGNQVYGSYVFVQDNQQNLLQNYTSSTESSYYTDNYGYTYKAKNALDTALNTAWYSNATSGYITASGTSGVAQSYRVTGWSSQAYWVNGLWGWVWSPQYSTANQAPKAWTLEGSNDGSSWVILDTQTSQTAWADGEERTFNIANGTAYSRYKLNITQNNGNLSVISVVRFAVYPAAQTTGSNNLSFRAYLDNNYPGVGTTSLTIITFNK